MFGLNPITLYAIAFLLFTNLFTFAGWRMATHEVEQQNQRATVAEEKLALFTEQVRSIGEEQEQRTAEVIATAKEISTKKDSEYAKNLDRLRADNQRLRRDRASEGAGGGAVPAVSDGPRSLDEIPANCLPLAEQSAETTLMLITLQEWVAEQSGADHGR